MSRKTQGTVALAVALIAGPVTLAAAATSSVSITVSPRTGATHTRFLVDFKAPASSGGSSTTRDYSVSVSSPQQAGGRCASSAARQIGTATAGQRIPVALTPGAPKTWCAGLYRGTLTELVRPRCGYRELCPAFIAELVLGRFEFRVR